MKKQQTTQQLLASIKVNVTQALRELSPFFLGSNKIPSYTKKGPGRKHQQGHARYIPRQEEKSSYRRKVGDDSVLLW